MQSEFADDPGVRWMLAYQAGDEGAFDRLVETYSPQVFALLTRFLGARSNREDMVQEVFLRVIRARERYEPSARFSTWLYRIAFNLSVNESQRVGGKEFHSADASPSIEPRELERMDELTDERAADPGAQLAQSDIVRAVRRAIARLPENQRMVLILAKYEEIPYVDIASVIGSSEKAVKSLVHRARESLREQLSSYLQGELS